MLDNSQTPPYSATSTFSLTTVSLQHLFSTNHFFGKYSMFIPLTKIIETTRRMASELSTETTKTSTSFDSSSATSKVNIQYPIHTNPLILQFTAVLHNDMRLPNCAMTHVNACGQHMTILRRFGPPLQWNVVVVDGGVGRKYVVQP
ncbi:hypothetical protein AAZX31_20G060100 [Glycine max]